MAGMLAVYEGADRGGRRRCCASICDWAQARGEESGIPVPAVQLLACSRGCAATSRRRSRWPTRRCCSPARSAASACARLALGASEPARTRRAATVAGGTRGRRRRPRAHRRAPAYMPAIPWLLASEGLLELALGDAQTAERALGAARRARRSQGRPRADAGLLPAGRPRGPDPSRRARAGRARCSSAFARRGAVELDRPWAIANALRCRSLLAAAQGDLDAAARRTPRRPSNAGRRSR